MTNWSTLIKKLMQTYIVKVSGSILNISTAHLNGIWHLIWRYLSKPVLGGHPVLSGHYSIPWGCPLNTGFTILIFMLASKSFNMVHCTKASTINLQYVLVHWYNAGTIMLVSWWYNAVNRKCPHFPQPFTWLFWPFILVYPTTCHWFS